MSAKDTGLVGLTLVGIVVTIIGFYIGYLWLGSESVLMLLGALVLIISGITMAAIGFNAD